MSFLLDFPLMVSISEGSEFTPIRLRFDVLEFVYIDVMVGSCIVLSTLNMVAKLFTSESITTVGCVI